MKTLPPILKYAGLAVAVGSVLAMAACATLWAQRGTVTIEKDDIILHPGTKISQADAKALNEVLKKYDKRLYRIDIYRNGQKQKSLGRLRDVYLDRKVVSEVAAWTGTSDWTVQITIYNAPAHVANYPHHPAQNPPIMPIRPNTAGKELMERLKPILEPYSKRIK